MNKKALASLKADVQDVLKGHPGLRLKFNGEVPSEIWGTYCIYDDGGALQGCFDIRVLIPATYPYGFPVLLETAGKIERTIDRHIGPGGLICEEIDQKELMLASKSITIREYFAQYVHKHFCWQLIYEEEGNKNLQEWSHHGDGTMQFYKEQFNSDDPRVIETCLKALAHNTVSGRNDPCACGSGKKTKRCHHETFVDLGRIGKAQLVKDLAEIQSKLSKIR